MADRPVWLAFLRGVNLGKRTVKGPQLVAAAEAVGCEDAHAFLASGNLWFTPPAKVGAAALEDRFEEHFAGALGFEVETFVRTLDELVAVVERGRRPDLAPKPGGTVHVGFLKAKPTAAVAEAVAALSNDDETLLVDGREAWWRLAGGLTSSVLKPGALEGALGPGLKKAEQKALVTLRNLNTPTRLVEKLR